MLASRVVAHRVPCAELITAEALIISSGARARALRLDVCMCVCARVVCCCLTALLQNRLNPTSHARLPMPSRMKNARTVCEPSHASASANDHAGSESSTDALIRSAVAEAGSETSVRERKETRARERDCNNKKTSQPHMNERETEGRATISSASKGRERKGRKESEGRKKE